jgi:large subunit ribosomal protein L13
MTLLKKKTTMANPATYKRQWFVFDATGKILGRFASEIAKVLRGKHKATYTTHEDAGDGVIVINAEKIKVTGAKEAQKIYRHHTGAMSGMRETPYRTMKARKPEYIIEKAVHGMVPRSRLGRQQVKRLKVFKGAEHNLQAQQPIVVNTQTAKE